MALQYSTTLRNAQLDAIETVISTTPKLRIYDDDSEGLPANVAAAVTGNLLVEMDLPSDWMAAASSGSKAMSGTWQDSSANGTGTATYFRIYASDGTTAHIQGSVGQGSGDLQLNNVSIVSGQQVSITSFAIAAGNA